MPTINGTSGDDTLTGTNGPDTINGLDGNDTINGDAGDDTLDGGDGDDTLVGGAGNDTLGGGVGRDLVSFQFSGLGVRAFLWDLRPQPTGEGSDTLTSIEDLRGSNHNDLLIGDGGSNSISGLDGNDVIGGQGGIDNLEGGAGNDVYLIESPDDHTAAEIADSDGYDTVRFATTVASTLTLFADDEGIERAEITLGTDLQGVVARNDGSTSMRARFRIRW